MPSHQTMIDELMTPRYEHRCATCRFLGQHKKYDLYFHDCGTDTYYVIRYGNGIDETMVGETDEVSRLNSGEFANDGAFIEAHKLVEDGR